jgi:hypothetical protein
LYQFDHEFEAVYAAIPFADAPFLTRATFLPRGNTALYDAMGRVLSLILSRFTREDKVVFVTVTDGGENASKEFRDASSVKALMKKATERGWECMFIGANQDSIFVAQQVGIAPTHSMNYAANAVGTRSMYNTVSQNLASYSAGATATMGFTDEDRKLQRAAGAAPEAKTDDEDEEVKAAKTYGPLREGT